MPPITLHGSAMSTSRVLVTVLKLNLPYKLNYIDISKNEHKTAEFRKMQPFGKVPVLEDDGFVVFESRAICRYLVRKYDSTARTKLVPDNDDNKAYARFEQACSMEQSYFAAAAETLGTELVIKKMKGFGPPDEARVAQANADLETVLGVYEAILAKQKYLAGDEMTLADLFHLPNGAALKAGPWKEVFERYPFVDKWFTGLQEREIWIRAAAETETIP